MATHFRKDITGLRAIAVFTVVLFHISIIKPNVNLDKELSVSSFFSDLAQWFVGGFVGVDIFFVISGYLMTGIIMLGLTQNNFSFLNFYKKRAKRIVPALLVVILFSLLIFEFLLNNFNSGGESVKALIFTTNFHYLKNADYFHTDAFSWYLLHTWSLSVEWQFYLIYPVILVLIKRLLGITHVGKSLLILTILSFAFAMYEVHNNARAAYYMLPSRAFEMLVGGLAYIYPLSSINMLKNTKINSDVGALFCKYLGIGLIVISLFIANSNKGWPNVSVLLPIIGAYLVIASKEKKTILDTALFQKIGLWSYSIYLVHWTVLVFNNKLSLSLSPLVLLFIVVVLGFLLHIFVEKRRNYGYKFLVFYLIALSSTSIYADHFEKEFSKNKYINNQISLLSDGANYALEMSDGIPTVFGNLNKNIDLIIYGDSYARQYIHALEDQGLNFIAIFHDGAYFLGGGIKAYFDPSLKKSPNDDFYFNNLMRLAKKYPNTPIFIAQNWGTYKNAWLDADYKIAPIDRKTLLNHQIKDIEFTLVELKKISKAPIIFSLPQFTNYSTKPFICSNFAARQISVAYNFFQCGKDEILLRDYDYAPLYKSISSIENIHIFEPSRYICNVKTQVMLPIELKCKTNFDDGVSMFYDENHLSYESSRIVVPHILKMANLPYKDVPPNKGHDHSTITRLDLVTLNPYEAHFKEKY